MTDDVKTPEEGQEEGQKQEQEPTNEAPSDSEQKDEATPPETEEEKPSPEATPEEPPSDTPSENELGAIYDVPVQVSAVLGKANLHVNQLLKLGRGAVVELDRKVGEAIDIFVNNRLVARGEIVVMDDDHIGVTMTEIIKTESKKL